MEIHTGTFDVDGKIGRISTDRIGRFPYPTGQAIPAQWIEEGKLWSPAQVADAVPTADAPYAGPVLNMTNFIVDPSNVDDASLWGNIAASK